jgi:hypothetical protein
MGSAAAFSAMTEWSIGRNFGLSLKVLVVGGSLVVEPIARDGVGGSVGNRESRYDEEAAGCSNTYYQSVKSVQTVHL